MSDYLSVSALTKYIKYKFDQRSTSPICID